MKKISLVNLILQRHLRPLGAILILFGLFASPVFSVFTPSLTKNKSLSEDITSGSQGKIALMGDSGVLENNVDFYTDENGNLQKKALFSGSGETGENTDEFIDSDLYLFGKTDDDLGYIDRDEFLYTEPLDRDYFLVNRGSAESEDDLLFGSIGEDDMPEGWDPLPDMNFQEDNKTIYVHSGTLNMRTLPTADSEIMYTFKRGDSFKRTGIGEKWSRITDSNNRIGYVFNEYTGTAKPTPTPTPKPKYTAPAKANTLGESIAKEAQKYLGVRYRHGATDPDYGFDCTGLTYYVFQRYGITLPRSSYGFKNAGTIIPYSQIAPGDIISWDTRRAGRVTHVGLYIGNGMMIHASSSKGKVVIVSVAKYQAYSRMKLLQVHRFYK